MIKTRLAAALLITGAIAVAPSANAGIIVHDRIATFTSIVGLQGQATNSDGASTQLTNVAGARSILGNMFDGDSGTTYTMGLGGTGAGGSLIFVISPTTNFITSGSLIELTLTGSGHQEAALVSLGVNGGGYVDIGTLINAQAAGGPGVTNIRPGVATLSFAAATGSTTFSLNVINGRFNTLKLQDQSIFATGPGGTTERDGFDVAEFRLTSTDVAVVSTPATLALVGVGLLGVCLTRRRS